MAVKNMTKKQIQTFFERLRAQRPPHDPMRR